MPYKSLQDLPETIKHTLPTHAQEIYLAAYNHAFEEYKAAKDRQDNATREETAHKVAWAAVKHKFEKNGDKWRLK